MGRLVDLIGHTFKLADCCEPTRFLMVVITTAHEKIELEYHKIIHMNSEDIKNNLSPKADYLLERCHESILCSQYRI
jgi:hypothetical protein